MPQLTDTWLIALKANTVISTTTGHFCFSGAQAARRRAAELPPTAHTGLRTWSLLEQGKRQPCWRQREVGKSMGRFGRTLQTAGLSQEMLPVSGLRNNKRLFYTTASLAGEHKATTSAATHQSAQMLARLAMVRVVLGEDKLLKRVQADVAADGSVAQLSIWHRR